MKTALEAVEWIEAYAQAMAHNRAMMAPSSARLPRVDPTANAIDTLRYLARDLRAEIDRGASKT